MAGGKRKAEEDIDRGDGYKNGAQMFGTPSTEREAPDSKRKAECLNSVVALNTQFVSWIDGQQKDRPFDLWRGGVKDYLRHAETILSDFHDVVDWIHKSSTIPSGSPSEASKPDKPNSVKETKLQSADASKFNGEQSRKETPAVANGGTSGQEKAIPWGGGKSGELSTGGKGGDLRTSFFGLVSDKKENEKRSVGETAGGAGRSTLPGWGSSFGTSGNDERGEGVKDAGKGGLPGWGSGFNSGGKDANAGGSKESAKGGLSGWGLASGTSNKDDSKDSEAGKEGGEKGLFDFQAGKAGFGSKVGSSALPTASTSFNFSIQPAPQKETPGSSSPAPLFSAPALKPPVSGAPPTTSDTNKCAPPLFSVPHFSMPISAPPLPAIKTSVPAFGAPDWAAGFSKPASGSGSVPAFSLQGTGTLFGGGLAINGGGLAKGTDRDGEKTTEADGGEGEAAAEPVSPSLKAAQEEGVESVLDTPIKLWRLRESKWEDQGTGSLMLRRDKGAPRKSKEANARIVVRNQGGRILLNALLYPGMKLDVQKTAVNVFLHTTELRPGKSNSDGTPVEPVSEVVSRPYALRKPKEGGISAEELKAAIEKEVPNGEAPDA